jgi:hypothetical protein
MKIAALYTAEDSYLWMNNYGRNGVTNEKY